MLKQTDQLKPWHNNSKETSDRMQLFEITIVAVGQENSKVRKNKNLATQAER